MEVRITDVEFVDGVYKHHPHAEQALYNHCKDYFDNHYYSFFFTGKENLEDIFQESFIALWENIEKRKLYVENGVLMSKGGKPFSASITTYFMAIAIRKYKEWARENRVLVVSWSAKEENQQFDELTTSPTYDIFDIIRDCISNMSQRCYQILTMFYDQEFSLDRILHELPSFNSKNALKTQKYKCLENLRKSASEIQHNYLNA